MLQSSITAMVCYIQLHYYTIISSYYYIASMLTSCDTAGFKIMLHVFSLAMVISQCFVHNIVSCATA